MKVPRGWMYNSAAFVLCRFFDTYRLFIPSCFAQRDIRGASWQQKILDYVVGGETSQAHVDPATEMRTDPLKLRYRLPRKMNHRTWLSFLVGTLDWQAGLVDMSVIFGSLGRVSVLNRWEREPILTNLAIQRRCPTEFLRYGLGWSRWWRRQLLHSSYSLDSLALK